VVKIEGEPKKKTAKKRPEGCVPLTRGMNESSDKGILKLGNFPTRAKMVGMLKFKTRILKLRGTRKPETDFCRGSRLYIRTAKEREGVKGGGVPGREHKTKVQDKFRGEMRFLKRRRTKGT